MNEVNPESKGIVTKLFALVGFAAIIILTVYLVVRVVNLAPDWLAGLTEPTTPADTETEASLIITADKDSLALNETITISWSSPIAGNYTFTAECDAGVVLSRETADDSVPIPCQQTILLDGETSITLTPLESETETAEVYYVIGLIDRENDDLLLESDSYFIITNPEANQDEENSPISVSSGDTPSTAPQRPQTGSTIIPVYRRPVSDPNGLVDLVASSFGFKGSCLTEVIFRPEGRVAANCHSSEVLVPIFLTINLIAPRKSLSIVWLLRKFCSSVK